MFDIGFWEMAMIGVVALVIIGPERLPKVARTVGLWTGKARRMMRDVKADIKREMNEQDLADLTALKKDIQSAGDEIKGATGKIKDSVGAEDLTESLKESFAEVSPLDKDGQLKTDSESSADASAAKSGKATSNKTKPNKTKPNKTTSKRSDLKTSVRKKPAGSEKAAKTTGKKASSKKASSKKAGPKTASLKKADPNKISPNKISNIKTSGTAGKKPASKKTAVKKPTIKKSAVVKTAKAKVAKSKVAGRNPDTDKSSEQPADTA